MKGYFTGPAQIYGPALCKVCKGKACRGGNNAKCAQRQRDLSVVAGLLNHLGYFHVVVSQEWRIWAHHVRDGDTCIIVPDFTVREPVTYHQWPEMESRARWAVRKWIERGPPNEPDKWMTWRLYQLHEQRYPTANGSVDLEAIVYT